MLRVAREAFYESLDRHTLADCAKGSWFDSLAKTQADKEPGPTRKRSKEPA